MARKLDAIVWFGSWNRRKLILNALLLLVSSEPVTPSQTTPKKSTPRLLYLRAISFNSGTVRLEMGQRKSRKATTKALRLPFLVKESVSPWMSVASTGFTGLFSFKSRATWSSAVSVTVSWALMVARPKGLRIKRNARAPKKLTVDSCGSWKKWFAMALIELQPWHTNAEETRIMEMPHSVIFSENKIKI